MPVHENSIGDFEFLQMGGSPYLRQEQLELIERPGVDGTGVRKLGQRGKPFELVTINYEADFDAAAEKMEQYKALVGDDPVELVRMDIEEGEYLVLEVREQQLFPILNSIGGLEGGEEACHVVSWTLLG